MDDLIRSGLCARQKSLPAGLLYDDLGSVLFEAITLLPEYGVTRADTRLLELHARSLFESDRAIELIELGPGHGRKAQLMLSSLGQRPAKSRFVAIDVSTAALDACRTRLEDLDVDYVGLQSSFLDGLRALEPGSPQRQRVVAFLGSNLSNFDRLEARAFFAAVRAALRPGDALVLSADLHKPVERLLPAYDDALGVTAAFNLNVLAHLNRAWGATFELDAFRHEARWNEARGRVEMHLRARRACQVRVDALALDVAFTEGETIHTESSHRFTTTELEQWAGLAAMRLEHAWTDDAWPFVLAHFVAT